MLMYTVDVGAMEDDHNTILFDEVDLDLDMGVGISLVEDPIMDVVENEEVDCSDAFQTSEVAILLLFLSVL